MNKKKHLRIQAYTHVTIGLIFTALLFIYKPEIYFIIFGTGFILYSAYKAFTLFTEAEKAAQDEHVELDPLAGVTTEEKIRHYKRILYFGVPALSYLPGSLMTSTPWNPMKYSL